MPTGHSAEKKAEIMRCHFAGNMPEAEICEKYGISPDIFARWKDMFLKNGDLIFRQIPHDGMEYYHNYDLVLNWLSETFRGRTLDVLGIGTGEIRRVCSYKPVEISVSAGVLDVVFENHAGEGFRVEGQRNMTEDDLYRFAAQHFSAAREWRDRLTDIVLASGTPYTGKKEIRTPGGKYAPVIIDLTERDGPGRFEDIREALDSGDMSALTELVFLPLYGRRGEPGFVREVLRYEIGLYRQGRISPLVVAATFIMANKEIDRETFQELWEEMKMLEIFEYAREMAMKEGKEIGIEIGILKDAREMVMEALTERFVAVPKDIMDKVCSFTRHDLLKQLLRHAIRSSDIEEFRGVLSKVMSAS